MLMNNFQLVNLEICILLSIIGLMINKNHLLMSLLFLETTMLGLVIMIPMSMLILSTHTLFISIIMLAIGACEASLGLALMVMMSRTYGSDMMKSMNMFMC